MTTGATLQESILCAGESASEVRSRLASTLAGQADLRVVESGEGSVQVVRTYRPTWALVLGIIGLALCGVGVLFLLVKKTETCSIQIVDAARGAVVTMTGVAAPSVVEAVRGVACGPSADVSPSAAAPVAAPQTSTREEMPAPIVAAAPVVAADADPDQTIMRGRQPETNGLLCLRFDDGTEATVDHQVLVGRAPEVPVGATAQTVSVDDPGRMVSKTHLAVRSRDGALWVEDLRSTNGTIVEHPTGSAVDVRPGIPERLLPGSVVVFGDHRFEVIASE